MPFYVKSEVGLSEAYHTGEFDRSFPPDPYITQDIKEAASWESKEGAEAWASQFGGKVVEINKKDYSTITESIERDGLDCLLTLRIKNGKAFASGWSLNTKINIEVFEDENGSYKIR
jgi:hypothetical protein